jgi:serine/threonine-protein kinase
MAAPPASDAGHVLLPGVVFHGVYQVVRCMRSGGMGAVYEVVHTPTRRRRALKVMHPCFGADAEMRTRFRREATAAADVESEHVVETIDAGVDDATGVPFIAMELLRGEDLGQLVRRRGVFAPHEVVMLLTQVARALDLTHAAGIIHRDLKPENLFLTLRDDGTPRVKILDFGVAKLMAESAVADSTGTVGTPLYMAPEQVQGGKGLSPSADLYALAHVAYTLLVGRAYWAEDRAAAGGVVPFLVRLLEGNPEAPSVRAARRNVALPPAFDAWFARATAVAPQHRFASAGLMLQALGEAVAALPESVPGAAVARMRDMLVPAPAAGQSDVPPADSATTPMRSGAASGAGPSQLGVVSDANWPRAARRPLLLVFAALAIAGVFVLVVLTWTSNPSHESAGPNPAPTSSEDTPAPAALESESPEPAATEASATAPSARASARAAASHETKTRAVRGTRPRGNTSTAPAATGDPLDTY